jgi:hypothetical protein
MSSETARLKVLKMMEDGRLKLYCVPNSKYFGKRRLTFILSAPMHKKAEVIKRLEELPFVLEMRSGILSGTIIMDIVTQDVDEDTHRLLEIAEKLGLEVKEIFESEHVHFDPGKILQTNSP